MNNFFSDLKVIDLSNALAGPSAGQFFAELGANVIKFENPATGGDITRSWKTPDENSEDEFSAYFASINLFKEIRYCNLKTEDGKAAFFKELEDADIFITNLKPESQKKLGVELAKVANSFPKLIIVNLVAYDPDNPRTAFDFTLQAECGYMHLNAKDTRSDKLKFPVAFIDVLAGHQIKEAILIALLKRTKTSQGSWIEVSLYKSALTGLINQASAYLNTGVIPEPKGSLHPSIAPYGESFLSKDKILFVLGIGTDQQFVKLLQILKIDDENIHKRYALNVNRVRNRILLANYLQSKFDCLFWKELNQAFLSSNIPFGRINNLNEVFRSNLAQEMIKEHSFSTSSNYKAVSAIAFNFLK